MEQTTIEDLYAKRNEEDLSFFWEDGQPITPAIPSHKHPPNTFGSHKNLKDRKEFMAICKNRVLQLMDYDRASCKYIFAPYFFKKIYADLATCFNVKHWHDINIEHFEDFDRVVQTATRWTPSESYVGFCLRKIIDKRNNNKFDARSCMALTEYLSKTNNGNISLFD